MDYKQLSDIYSLKHNELANKLSEDKKVIYQERDKKLDSDTSEVFQRAQLFLEIRKKCSNEILKLEKNYCKEHSELEQTFKYDLITLSSLYNTIDSQKIYEKSIDDVKKIEIEIDNATAAYEENFYSDDFDADYVMDFVRVIEKFEEIETFIKSLSRYNNMTSNSIL